MDAQIAQDQFSFSLGQLTYVGPFYGDDEAAPAAEAPHRGVLSRLRSRFAEWKHRRAVMLEMAMMTDHELSDIGLSRADLPRIFDPAFIADRACGRDYVAY